MSKGGFADACWFGKLEQASSKHQLVYRFQQTVKDGVYREIGGVENVWINAGVGGTANVVTKVTYAGAAALTSAAGAIVLGLLF